MYIIERILREPEAIQAINPSLITSLGLLFIRPLLRLWHKTHVCLIRTVSIVDGETSRLMRE